MKKETWKDVVGFEGLYKISDRGRVLSLANSRSYYKKRKNIILKPRLDRYGYFIAILYKNKKPYWRTVHRLVMDTFILNTLGKPQINHIDGNRRNNQVINLEWCTGSENKQHSYNIGISDAKGEKNGRAKLTTENVVCIREQFKNGQKRKKLAEIYCVGQSNINKITNYKRWAHI